MTVFKRLRITAGALAFACLASAAMAEDLRIATEGAYPPFNYVEPSGEIKGFDVEIANALCKKLNANCTIVAQDWDGIIPGLLAKKYDLIVASMFITEERKKQIAFSDPYYASAMTLVAPKGAGLTDLTDKGLSGKTIGAQAGATQADYLQATFPSADIRLYPNQDEVNLDLASGRLDLEVGDMVPMAEWLHNTADGACCEMVGEPIRDPAFVGEGVGIGLRKEDDTLRQRINAALKEMREDGTYQAINDKYFDIDIYTLK
ncbi:ABC transporter substrate-binding protein [Thioclava sp. GXIMD4215]|uniref:ABC transporter substrate-binding protein n=1 Tax=Thioclava sp. GXIMD4215 TaxID=3131928 RepID=UPI00311B1E80